MNANQPAGSAGRTKSYEYERFRPVSAGFVREAGTDRGDEARRRGSGGSGTAGGCVPEPQITHQAIPDPGVAAHAPPAPLAPEVRNTRFRKAPNFRIIGRRHAGYYQDITGKYRQSTLPPGHVGSTCWIKAVPRVLSFPCHAVEGPVPRVLRLAERAAGKQAAYLLRVARVVDDNQDALVRQHAAVQSSLVVRTDGK